MKISVVVPTYRRPSLLHQCLKALVNQHFDNNHYELIIVSDGPDNDSRQVVNNWKEQSPLSIAFITLPSKNGPAAARNRGWQVSGGSLIAFTDDDCIPDSGWLAALWTEYNNEDEIAFTGRVIVPINNMPTDFEKNTQGLETAAFVTANCACSKKALEKVKGFDEAFRLAWREDSDLQFKLLENNIPIRTISEAVVIHPVRQAPWGVSIKEQKKGMFNALLYRKYPALYRQKIQKRPAWNYYAIILLFLTMIINLPAENIMIVLAAGIGWLALMFAFIRKRLCDTSHSFNHVAEMIVTSLVIPFLSVFWQIYGACKYRVLLF